MICPHEPFYLEKLFIVPELVNILFIRFFMRLFTLVYPHLNFYNFYFAKNKNEVWEKFINFPEIYSLTLTTINASH